MTTQKQIENATAKTQAELAQVRANGKQELMRRGIPKNKEH